MFEHIPEYFECDKCYKTFDKLELLQKHQKSKVVCNTLRKIIKNSDIRYQLYNNKVGELDTKTYKSETNTCFYCNTSYETKSKLRRHVELQCIVKKNLVNQVDKYNDINSKKTHELKEITKQKRDMKKLINSEFDLLKDNLKCKKLSKTNSIGTININNDNITNTINNTTERTIIVNLTGSIEDGIIFIDIKEL
jgi:hypothetical protein